MLNSILLVGVISIQHTLSEFTDTYLLRSKRNKTVLQKCKHLENLPSKFSVIIHHKKPLKNQAERFSYKGTIFQKISLRFPKSGFYFVAFYFTIND